ncbi:adenosylmethionine decarboxylase [Calidithermus timidus]|uniref:adenosylmethionine decarboxylase n=1 Tax=Calidithermus timidus TaxID=307124 RepID=UPI000399803B|nr:adenosylmethionine decarboxylase [Calidithermus timidus]
MELFGFGPHLMIDGYNANAEKLADFELVRRVLDELPTEMGMTKVLPPFVYRYDGQGGQSTGVTGVVLIAESHIAIHTFPEKRFVSVDIFSCKEFDLSKALSSVVEKFEIGRYETYLINRGKEFPKDPDLARQIVLGEREYLEARVG